MIDKNFEGTLVLEKLAEIGRVDDFLEAVDSDDFDTAKLLMRKADIDLETMSRVLRIMRDGN